jgi:signal transduction histidine kinase
MVMNKKQVFSNLLNNAIKFIEKGEIVVALNERERERERDMVRR